MSSLAALNRQFTQWVEEQNNAQVHSILGMSPLDRYALDRQGVGFLPPNEANDERFFVEEERQVRADNTFSFKSLRWEAPRHLPDRTIQIRFQRSLPASRVVVYDKGERMGEARLLDEEIRSRITYSALLPRLAPETVEKFILDQLDRVGLGHNPFTPEALALIVRSGEGLLRRTRNLCLGALIEAVRDQSRGAGKDIEAETAIRPNP